MDSVGEGTKTPQQSDVRPVFVVGNPRSGTTLVQQILSAHTEFWTAPETHIFDYVMRAAPDAATKAISAEKLNTLLKRLEKRSRLTLAEHVHQEMIAQANNGTLTGPRFVELVMRSFKTAGDPATRWVEKTPQHLLHLDKIWQYFPDAPVINIVRDPRDVVSSPSRFRKYAPGLARTIAVVNIAWRWNRFIERASSHTGDPRFLSIRYEDLVNDPERILEQLAAHAGTEKDSSAIHRFNNQFAQVTLTNPSVVNKSFNSADELVDRRGIWKKRLTEQEAKIIETICGPLMERHGYRKEYPRSVWASAQIASISGSKQLKQVARNLRNTARSVYRRVKRQA
jgi:hypothetical protein